MSAQTAVLTPLQRLLRIDESAFLRLRALERPALTPLMRAVTRAGNTSGWVVQGLVLLALARPLGLRLGLAAGLATVVVQLLKRTCRRARPSRGIAGFAALASDPDAFSFPSGHTAVACAVAVALLAAAPGLGTAELLLAGSIAISRVYLGAHYPLDVAAGATLGAVCGLLAPLALAML